ncbi:hypothetical protein OK414_29490 [Priestia sp. JV24]|uniref:hypothetical protein n=1 Tax=Priestia TaxID=2800373 RepID=UPI0021D69547|nr:MULTISPECIES: hypothetical protein [Priestia]MCU7713064.1 hypothetical protein [Priestia megaterium]MCW1049189.1 hypothetical protein [Priestia sp. JV24]
MLTFKNKYPSLLENEQYKQGIERLTNLMRRKEKYKHTSTYTIKAQFEEKLHQLQRENQIAQMTDDAEMEKLTKAKYLATQKEYEETLLIDSALVSQRKKLEGMYKGDLQPIRDKAAKMEKDVLKRMLAALEELNGIIKEYDELNEALTQPTPNDVIGRKITGIQNINWAQPVSFKEDLNNFKNELKENGIIV